MLTWTWDETTDSGLPQMSGVYASYKIICRNGTVAPFEPSRISQAMMKAFLGGARQDRVRAAHLQCVAPRHVARDPANQGQRTCNGAIN